MARQVIYWTLAFLITGASAVYQRMTGPTYPVSGSVVLNGKKIKYSIERSHGGDTDHTVAITTNDSTINGVVEWRRYKTKDEFTLTPMRYENGALKAELPHQPPAGKLEYRVMLADSARTVSMPEHEHAVIRFKGEVPTWVLIIHVFFMFGAMLLSARTGLEFFSKQADTKKLTKWTVVFLFIGGFILGPAVQWYAFGALWTGWPFGTDLTDNKTLFAFVAWIAALVAAYKSKHPARWALAAAIVTLLVYLIPHSMMGSELDYSKLPQQR